MSMETCPSGLRCDVGSVVWLIPTMSSNLIVSAIADNSSSELFFYLCPLVQTQKKSPFGLIFLLGRLMGFEPTSDGATIRCVNHFTTIAMCMLDYT